MRSDKSHFRKTRVAFLTRDVRDVVVSYYFHLTFRENKFNGSLSEFIRHDIWGINKLLQFYKNWEESSHVPADFMVLSYEELHLEFTRTMRRVVNFFGISDIDDSSIRRSYTMTRFERMQTLEASNQLSIGALTSPDPGDPRTFKVREGAVGSFRAYLSANDIAYIDGCIDDFNISAFPVRARFSTP